VRSLNDEEEPDMRLEGKVAVVTGGASGIGEAISIRFREEGATVAVLDLNVEAARLTADVAGGGLALGTDVSDSAAVDAALAEVEEKLGPVDVWVNNAGISGRAHAQRVNPRAEQQMMEMATGTITTPLNALIEVSDDEYQQMVDVHLGGTFYGMRAAARSMVARGTGSIVNVASICGIEGCAGHPHYSAAKAGILGLTRSVAKELILQGVRVNAVAPGFVVTPMMTADASETMIAGLALGTPIGRLGRPAEIAAAVAFLASDDASFFVGETISPNGGFVTV
jgi:3-oxoacyl-[acyl-carrier protein] reductase